MKYKQPKIKIGDVFKKITIIERVANVGNNLRYLVECDCGVQFVAYSFQILGGRCWRCKECAKFAINKRQEGYRRKCKLSSIEMCAAIKYTLEDKDSGEKLFGNNGKYLFFSLPKAKIAARSVKNAKAVPL